MTTGVEHDGVLAAAVQDFDITHPVWSTDFHRMQDYMRQQCPVLHSEHQGGYFVITKHADILEVLRDHETYSSAGGVFLTPLPGGRQLIPTDMDPPIQRDFRRLVDRHLAPATIAPLVEPITQTAHELIDTFVSDGHCDIYRDFAGKLPNQVFLRHVLGIDQKWEEAANHQVELAMSSETYEEVEAGFNGLAQWCSDLLDERTTNPHPGDLVDALLTGKVQGRPLTKDEQVSTLMSVTIGGLETASSVISGGVIALIQNSEQQQRLRDDPSLIPEAIEEIARIGSPTALMRTVTRETTLDGQDLHPQDRILIVFGAANRDPDVFAQPHDFDIARDNAAALSFGIGLHRCPGSNLARMVLRIAFEALLDRLQNLQLEEEVTWTSTQIRSPKSVRISFEAAS